MEARNLQPVRDSLFESSCQREVDIALKSVQLFANFDCVFACSAAVAAPHGIAYCPATRELFVTTYGGQTVFILDDKLAEQRKIAGCADTRGVECNVDGTLLYVAERGNQRINVI